MSPEVRLDARAASGQDRALVGIASFGASIEFYHVKNSDGSPQVLVVSDITEVFAPLPTLLIPLKDHKSTFTCIAAVWFLDENCHRCSAGDSRHYSETA